MKGLPSTKAMRNVARRAEPLNLKIGEAAISCIGELLGALRGFVVEEAEKRKEFGKYLKAFDNAVKLEMAYLKGLPPRMKMEFGVTLLSRGALDEMEALHKLLVTPLSGDADEREKQKEKQRAGASTFKKEIGDLWPGWLPKWLETVIESVLELL